MRGEEDSCRQSWKIPTTPFFFLSSRELAGRYDVDAATIVRTIQALGYQRFAEFAADLRWHFVTRITPYTILKAASEEKRR